MSVALGQQGQPCLALSCPLCPFATVELHRLRRHAIADHLRRRGGGVDGGVDSFRYKLYVCPDCAACSTDVDIVRDHAALAHRRSVDSGNQRGLLLLNEVCLTLPASVNGADRNGIDEGADPAGVAENPSRLVCKAGEGKYTCTGCHCSFPCSLEAAFHAATRHQVSAMVESDLARLGKLSEQSRADLMKRMRLATAATMEGGEGSAMTDSVESALFDSVELHLRLLCDTGELVCSDCNRQFGIAQLPEAVAHINDTVRRRLPDFMTSPGAPWSLHRREEWVWVVPDSQEALQSSKDDQQPSQLPPPTPPTPTADAEASNDASSSSATAAAAAASAAAPAVSGASRRKKLPVRYVPPRQQQPQPQQQQPTSSTAGSPGAAEESLASARHEAALRSGHWQVVSVDDDLFACSHCPDIMAARPAEIRLHIVAEHLGVPSLACAYCTSGGAASCDPEPVLAHCRSAHPGRVPQFVASELHRALCRLVPSPDDAGEADNDNEEDGEYREGGDDDDDDDDDEDGGGAAAAVLGEVEEDGDEDMDDENGDGDEEDEETAAAVAALEGAAGLVMDGNGDEEDNEYDNDDV
ncbi:hypothetical protein BOX15_Mlig009624g1 [Macrostomum lignano]|uniref:C2H2-type domain-containing protein n=1 Tax=Macrostomum lignano TaxID=282301 RepID=A0A267EA72_9PLAT|nr:hypothetical protein BOX15_Mlig009624g1 [Macrostomum lignano]